MDGANADSDHSMTWEDFFGSTTDLAPTLIELYDSLLDKKSHRPDTTAIETAKDARNDPPVIPQEEKMTESIKEEENTTEIPRSPPKHPSNIPGSVKLPIATVNKSSLYSIRTKSEYKGASDDISEVNTSEVKDTKQNRTLKEVKQTEPSTFNNLSPTVKRMLSGASETTTLKFQKKATNTVRSSTRHKSNIPLMGATSKISQSGVEILPSVDIYDQPCVSRNFAKSKSEDIEIPAKTLPPKVEFKLNEVQETYDVPSNNRPAIYDVPNSNTKTAFESLSLPYIDQSIELSISSNDREFDTKLSPQKSESKKSSPEATSAKFPKTTRTSSLHRKDFNKNDSPSNQLMNSTYPTAVGSAENLKSAIPEKEVVRLNPQNGEVPRPLSMSSIASSSSTSSSGVQNKGGVNSAYLASIESLDDQSDADLTSANNNFRKVEERPLENFPPRQNLEDELSGLSPLERVCAEIIQTENVYVEDLRQVIEGYLHVWRQQTTFSEEELSELFNNIEDIYAFNRSLCGELNACQLDASCIARCFVDNTDGFSVYTSYCTGYPRTMARLAALASVSTSALQFRERQAALGHPLPLASYLLKPVQRLLKYHLLLQNVVKQCASRDTQFALLKMTNIAQHIDDMKRRHEHAVRVQEIQSLLYGWNGPDLTTYGELCAEGTFRVFGAKAMRHLFLFDKLLLVTKNREDGILAYKMSIMCNSMMLVESIAGAPLSFQVIPWEAPRDQLTLQARSHRHKREWTLLLKRVILENYNAVIPSHARQLVMELGQNKTDDDILAEKSHNLITQASMRKQLSAPEYLEKRKLERERRKTCENNIRGTFKKNRKLTVPLKIERNNDCDCTQYSAEKGVDYTCDNCYADLCSDCEIELNKNKSTDYVCKHEDKYETGEKCPDCDKALHYIDSGSTEQIERRPSICKCSDFKLSQESFGKDRNNPLNKTRGYHSSDNIIGYVEKSKDESIETNSSLSNIRNIPKTCLKCEKIKENIVVTDTPTRKSRCADNTKSRIESMRSKSRDDPHRSKLSVIGTWRRKSEPGLQQNCQHHRRTQDSDNERGEKIEFECRNCGSTKMSRKNKHSDGLLSDQESENKKNLDVKVYTTKNIPKKISKIRKNRAKGFRLGSDVTAKFYTDLSTDVSTENILHISESTDSLNVDQTDSLAKTLKVPDSISKDEDIDEETYKKLIEKTDSFKKNELEKVKFLNKQKVIKEGSEVDEKSWNLEQEQNENVLESCEETEQPLEHIISQLLLQNRDFQMLLKKQQQRNSSHRRHQRLLKSYSNPEPVKSIEDRANGKFSRQSSDGFTSTEQNSFENTNLESQKEEHSEDDHIYETLRVEPRIDESLHNLNSKSKTIQHTHATRPKRLSSPPNELQVTEVKPHSPRNRIHVSESDYVYLSFEKLNKIKIEDTVYDVPVKSKVTLEKQSAESQYYEEMQNQGPPESPTAENIYDNIVEVCRRTKELPTKLSTEYLPMSPEQQSPNAPEIWVSQQKEHFNVSRDRKSGSLPRSFQIPVNNPDETNLSTFKTKPQANSKTYLNRDGKVLSMDRPFTIASDQSEISYDDLENYMSEGDVLKFNKSPTTKDANFSQELTKSTLELEEEIDRCYKNNFEKLNLENDKNKNISTSNSNLTTSINSSCEEQNDEQPKDDVIVHPEHKIYKPTSNLLSLKNVLSRFKNRNPKNTEEIEINANDQSSPDSTKSDIKSPTSEKKSALNPRSYSKNLLQRFRSIIGDDSDDNHNKTITVKTEVPEESYKNEIKVVITSTDASPTTSTIVYTINTDALSKSVFENTTLTDSQHEKNKIDNLSHSCDNIMNKKEYIKPTYAKSHSLTTTTLKETPISPSRTSSSKHSLNELPMYKLGSEDLGARIASNEYADPVSLEKSSVKNVNMFINKNSVRPDSLFSISSFVTSSSEGTSQDSTSRSNSDKTKENTCKVNEKHKSSDNYYEMKFERLEQFKDTEIFRDSAVYSDQEENDETKSTNSNKDRVSEIIAKVEGIKRNTSVRTQKVTITSQSKINVVNNKTTNIAQPHTNNSSTNTKVEEVIVKPKIAPPVPAKPKVTQIPTSTTITRTISTRTNNKVFVRPTNITKSLENSSSTESVNTKIVQKNASLRIPKRTDTTLVSRKQEVEKVTNDKDNANIEAASINDIKPGNIQIKRLSFERASLDSATRRIKTNTDSKRLSSQESTKVTTKSVLERRMEIEKIAKKDTSKPAVPSKKPSPIPIVKPIKVFDRSVSENENKEELKLIHRSNSEVPSQSTTSSNDNDTELNCNIDPKESWVKQVVNKFQ